MIKFTPIDCTVVSFNNSASVVSASDSDGGD